MTDVLAGAEAFSADGSEIGVLALHGFTGSPSSMRGLAHRMADAGYAVELPRLSGHGTKIEDMQATTWEDWTADVMGAYKDLASRTDKVVVAGLSMGGALTVWLATQVPELAGIIAINPVVMRSDPALVTLIKDTLTAGDTVFPALGSDIAKPDVVEVAYDGTPLAPLLSLFAGVDAMQADIAAIACPVLIFTSTQDHVVGPENSDFLASVVAGPVERVTCDESYHVVTQDHDAELVFQKSLDFVAKVTA
jgi:carboxylesterase